MQSPVLRSTRLRLSTFVVAFALVAASLFLIQHKAEASPVQTAAVAVVAGAGTGAVVAQFAGFDFRAIVCPILLAVRNAFARSPFFAFVQAILNQLLVAFGCTPSG